MTRPSTVTGEPSFLFVDEAAPPKVLKALADELQRRNRAISRWGNIRFEKSFTPELCRQFFAESCIQSGFFHRFACTVHSPVGL